jgi:hypothetical protein
VGQDATKVDEVGQILRAQRLLTEVSIRLALESRETRDPALREKIRTSLEAAFDSLDQTWRWLDRSSISASVTV